MRNTQAILSGIFIVTVDERIHLYLGAVHPTAFRPEISTRLIAVQHMYMRLDDALRPERLQA
jgi:hypothetical protein